MEYTGFIISVHPSVRLSVDRIVSALYLPQYSLDPFHIYKSYEAISEGVIYVMLYAKFQNLNFWQLFKICNWLGIQGIQYESKAWVIIGWRGIHRTQQFLLLYSLVVIRLEVIYFVILVWLWWMWYVTFNALLLIFWCFFQSITLTIIAWFILGWMPATVGATCLIHERGQYVDCLVQDCGISNVLAMDILQPCIKHCYFVVPMKQKCTHENNSINPIT